MVSALEKYKQALRNAGLKQTVKKVETAQAKVPRRTVSTKRPSSSSNNRKNIYQQAKSIVNKTSGSTGMIKNIEKLEQAVDTEKKKDLYIRTRDKSLPDTYNENVSIYRDDALKVTRVDGSATFVPAPSFENWYSKQDPSSITGIYKGKQEIWRSYTPGEIKSAQLAGYEASGYVPDIFRQETTLDPGFKNTGLTEREWEDISYRYQMGLSTKEDVSKQLEKELGSGWKVEPTIDGFSFEKETKGEPVIDKSLWHKRETSKIKALYAMGEENFVFTGVAIGAEALYSVKSHVLSQVAGGYALNTAVLPKVIVPTSKGFARLPTISMPRAIEFQQKLKQNVHFPTVYDVPLSKIGLAPEWSAKYVESHPVFATTGVAFEVAQMYGTGKLIGKAGSVGKGLRPSISVGLSKASYMAKGSKLSSILSKPGAITSRFKWLNQMPKVSRLGDKAYWTLSERILNKTPRLSNFYTQTLKGAGYSIGERILFKTPRIGRAITSYRTGISSLRTSQGLFRPEQLTYKGYTTSSFKPVIFNQSKKGVYIGDINEIYKVRPGLKYRPEGGWGEYLGYKKSGIGQEAGIIKPKISYRNIKNNINNEFTKFKGTYLGIKKPSNRIYYNSFKQFDDITSSFKPGYMTKSYLSSPEFKTKSIIWKDEGLFIPREWKGVYDIPQRTTISNLKPVIKPISASFLSPDIKVLNIAVKKPKFDFKSDIDLSQLNIKLPDIRTDTNKRQDIRTVPKMIFSPIQEPKIDYGLKNIQASSMKQDMAFKHKQKLITLPVLNISMKTPSPPTPKPPEFDIKLPVIPLFDEDSFNTKKPKLKLKPVGQIFKFRKAKIRSLFDSIGGIR